MRQKQIEISIKNMTKTGQGCGEYQGRPVQVWGALPGEKIVAELGRKKDGVRQAKTVDIFEAAPFRCPPVENHFLSCSPWQIMSYEQELAFKKERGIDIATDGKHYGYRNKMEYSFTDVDGRLSFAFFERAGRRRLPIDLCQLAQPAINEYAKNVLDLLQTKTISVFALKALMIRSNARGETIGALFVKDEYFPIDIFSEYDGNLAVYYSNPLSPASVPTKVLYKKGKETLSEELNGKILAYDILSFFQGNIPLFQKALNAMKPHVAGEDIVDMYSGVGAISIALADVAKTVVLVDNNAANIEYAHKNIAANHLESRYQAYLSPSEKALEYIEKDKVLIVDPPRAGLHADVVTKILEVRPKKIIYLSCNPETQARDVALLSEAYSVTHSQLFNFFPRTPHIESLIVLTY